MSSDDRQLCGDNAAPYVLGALDEQEHEEFRRHLKSCAVCREEVAALQVVTGALPAVATQHSAPPALKQRVMESVHEDLRTEAASGAVRGSAGSWRLAAPGWLRWRPLLAPGALAVAAIVLAVIALSSGGSSSGTRVFRAQAPAGANVSLRVSDGHAQLDIAGMPQTPAQRVYEVWIQRSGEVHPTDALFTVTNKGDATVGVPGSVDGVTAIMVTSEPLGGTKVPTSSPVIVARLS